MFLRFASVPDLLNANGEDFLAQPFNSSFKAAVIVNLRLDLVNMVVRPLLFTKSNLFSKPSLDKE